MMILITAFFITCFSSGLALEPHFGAPNVPPSLTGDIFRSFGNWKHREADGVDTFINKIKHRDDGEHTAPGNVLRAFGDLKFGLGDAADNVVDSVKTNLHKGKSAVGNIFGEMFHKKHHEDKHSTAEDYSNLSSIAPSKNPSVSIDVSSSASFTPTNPLYPYPDIKKPSIPRFIFVYDGNTRDLTVDEIIFAGKYLEEAKKQASNI